jgi:hypothetical protein
MKFLYTDDKTGKFSDTTLRTWIAFIVFIAYVIYLGFFDTEIQSADIEILQLLSLSWLGMGALYLGKRTLNKESSYDSHGNSGSFDSCESDESSSDPMSNLRKRGIQ